MKILYNGRRRVRWLDNHDREYEWEGYANGRVRVCNRDGQWKSIPFRFKTKKELVKWANIKKEIKK